MKRSKKDKKSRKDVIPGGLADKKQPADFNPIKLKAGIKVEMEHTSDPKIAEEIAMDHLTEDKDYYNKLKEIEVKKHILEKIELLQKALTGFKTKLEANPLVPAIKMPDAISRRQIKPIKLPGITTSSKKDPKMVAAQLKNPKPKKVNIEILKTDKNGQWSLEKATSTASDTHES